MHHPTDRIAHTTAFVTPVVEHWLEQEIAQWIHHEGSTRHTAHKFTVFNTESVSGLFADLVSGACNGNYVIHSSVLGEVHTRSPPISLQGHD